MSSTSVEENFEKIDKNPSDEILDEGDSEGSYRTEEELFNENFSDLVIKPENSHLKKNRKNSTEKGRMKAKNELCRLNLSVRCRKRNRSFSASKKSKKLIQRKFCKKSLVKSKNRLEKSETPKKGKRCRAGGKAKGKPPQLESSEKVESDEESENYFFSRISLGFFQKYRDLNGASTSNQLEEDHKRPLLYNSKEKMRDEISEEMELLELQKWGMSNNENLKKLEYLNPDTI